MKILKMNPFHDADLSNTNLRKKKRIYLGITIVAYTLVALFIFGMSTPGSYVQPEKGTHFGEVETRAGNYVGQLFKLAYEGEGEFQYLQGGTYKGNFSHSKREGEGTFTWANGDSFSGEWKEDAMQNGTYVFADGRTYTGTFHDNHYGDGFFELGNAAAKYGFVSYKAELQDGKITNLTFQKTDGATYDGPKDGSAKITYADGNTYEGEVADGKRSGNGVFTWRQGDTVAGKYEGKWTNDQMDGDGTFYYGAADYPQIKGTFKNGKLDGSATYYETASKTYKTQWNNGSCTNNNVR